MATILQDMFACPLINDSLSKLKANDQFDGIAGYNADGKPVSIPGGVLNAMIKLFLSEGVGIGVSKQGEIYVETMGNNGNMRVGVLYNPIEKILRACQFDPSNISTKNALISASARQIPYFAAIPFMVMQRITDKFKELADAWDEIIDACYNR